MLSRVMFYEKTKANRFHSCSFVLGLRSFSPAPSLSAAASLSAVGRLCDGVCMERIGGAFHTFRAAWWGVGSSLMNRVHLAGPQPHWYRHGLVIKEVILTSSRHNLFFFLFPHLTSKCLSTPASQKVCLLFQQSIKATLCSLMFLNYLFSPMPMVNPKGLTVGFSDSLALLIEVEPPEDSFQPSSSTQSDYSDCAVINESGLRPSDPAETLLGAE